MPLLPGNDEPGFIVTQNPMILLNTKRWTMPVRKCLHLNGLTRTQVHHVNWTDVLENMASGDCMGEQSICMGCSALVALAEANVVLVTGYSGSCAHTT